MVNPGFAAKFRRIDMSMAKTILFSAMAVLGVGLVDAFAAEYFTESSGGFAWTYRIEGGGAVIESGKVEKPAVSGNFTTNLDLEIPARLGGKPVTKIGAYAFFDLYVESEDGNGMGGPVLRSVKIPDTVVSIGYCAFEGNFLQSIELPANLQSIGAWAFVDNYDLWSGETLEVPEGVKDIGEGAFSDTGMKYVSIPASVTNIAWLAFEQCEELVRFDVDSSNPAYAAKNGVLFSKDQKTIVCFPFAKSTTYSTPKGVTRIAPCAFASCFRLSSVTISNGVTDIGMGAFNGCGLKSVTIPTSVTNIGGAAFSCEDYDGVCLTNITVDSKNPSYVVVGGVLFTKDRKTLVCAPAGMTGVYQVPAGTTRLDMCAFFSGETLTGIRLPDSLLDIGVSAFNGCEGLTELIVPDSVTNIGASAFCECLAMTNLSIPRGIANIGDSMFEACFELSSIEIPDNATNIGAWAFASCGGLTEVTIPAGVRRIGDHAFDGCSSLLKVTIPRHVETIGRDAFAGCEQLKAITIPASVGSIGDDAFKNCVALERICVPASWKGTDMLADTAVPAGCVVVYGGDEPPPESPYAAWLAGFGKTEAEMPEGVDADNDGATNGEEFIADTNPCDGNDVFMTRMSWTDGVLVLSASSVSTGRTYGIWVHTNLLSPGEWHPIEAGDNGIQWPLGGEGNMGFGGLTVALPE
jgi:hypothetical protein